MILRVTAAGRLHHNQPMPSPRSRRVTQAQYEMLAELRYRLRQFLHFSEQAAAQAGVTPQQHQALLAIRGFPARAAVRVGDLAERLQLRHHSAVGLVDRLVVERLVVRRRSSDDGREVLVALTARGEAVLEKLSAAHREQLNRIGPGIQDLLERLRAGNEDSA